MPRIDRIIKRAGMKEQLKQLQRLLKNREKQAEDMAAHEFKRGFALGGEAMRKAIGQAKEELKSVDTNQQ